MIHVPVAVVANSSSVTGVKWCATSSRHTLPAMEHTA
jgi:hypothetical protein